MPLTTTFCPATLTVVEHARQILALDRSLSCALHGAERGLLRSELLNERAEVVGARARPAPCTALNHVAKNRCFARELNERFQESSLSVKSPSSIHRPRTDDHFCWRRESLQLEHQLRHGIHEPQASPRAFDRRIGCFTSDAGNPSLHRSWAVPQQSAAPLRTRSALRAGVALEEAFSRQGSVHGTLWVLPTLMDPSRRRNAEYRILPSKFNDLIQRWTTGIWS